MRLLLTPQKKWRTKITRVRSAAETILSNECGFPSLSSNFKSPILPRMSFAGKSSVVAKEPSKSWGLDVSTLGVVAGTLLSLSGAVIMRARLNEIGFDIVMMMFLRRKKKK